MEPSATPAGGAPPGRTVVDGGGRVWHVFVVEEGMRWDPEIEMRRRSWLCCDGGDDRRFISPLPVDWMQWSDDVLLGAIAEAKPDHRG